MLSMIYLKHLCSHRHCLNEMHLVWTDDLCKDGEHASQPESEIVIQLQDYKTA